MITCTVDYGRNNDLTVMLTDTTYSGGFARIDVQENVVSYLVRYNNGATLSDTIDDTYHTNEVLQQAVYEVADALAFDGSNNDSNCDYSVAYTRLHHTLKTELNLC